MPSVATRAVTVRVSRQFTGTVECVFDAWLDPVTAGSFLFAADAGEVVRTEIDARIGGRFSFVRRENGTEIRRAGEYLSIDRPHLLAFSLSDNTRKPTDDRVIIELASVGLGSLLVLTHEMGLERYAERHGSSPSGDAGLACWPSSAQSRAARTFPRSGAVSDSCLGLGPGESPIRPVERGIGPRATHGCEAVSRNNVRESLQPSFFFFSCSHPSHAALAGFARQHSSPLIELTRP